METFSEPRFYDDTAAREYLERVLWANGPVCPHCGVVNHAYKTKRPGVYRCAEKACGKDFTVTMRTVMERSHIALHKWVLGFHLMCSSKKGVSAHQLHRTIGVTYRSAWFMAHRIREAMRAGGLSSLPPIGGEGKIVEADEPISDLSRRRNRATSTSRLTRSKGAPDLPRGARSSLLWSGADRCVPSTSRARTR
jgi:transposase-like protein